MTKTLALLLLSVLAGVILAGCSGGGADAGFNPLAGGWTGTWTSPETDQYGSTTFNVGADGKLNGTVHNVALDREGNITGDITNTGTFAGSIQYGEEDPIPLTGTVTVTSEGQFLGNLFQIIEGQQVPFDLNAHRP